jgi:hypothetical protein
MEITSPLLLNSLKQSVVDLNAFKDRLIEERGTIQYWKEFLALSSAIGRIEAVIDISEKK